MENHQQNFQCLICLDLAYKPIVQSCGHIFCFWCVHKAMDSKKPSQCPMCRRSYIHFPRVCTLLHRFLNIAFPHDYLARALETQEMEERLQVFSPRMDNLGMHNQVLIDVDRTPTSVQLDQISNSQKKMFDLFPTYAEKEQSTKEIDCHREMIDHEHNIGANPSLGVLKPTMLLNTLEHMVKDKINDIAPSLDDFPCALCNKLLYRPIVLNCGEAICESCLKTKNSTIRLNKCPSCECHHSRASLYVCLELHYYLQTRFPIQYQQRKDEVSSQFIEDAFDDTKHLPTLDDGLVEEEQLDLVHKGVGCDSCGMFPIVGRRYRCRDCPENVGYDLCGYCKEARCHTGRFNQKHQIHHQLEEVILLHSSTKQGILERVGHMAPFILSLQSNTIQQRRQTQEPQILPADFDDYVDYFL